MPLVVNRSFLSSRDSKDLFILAADPSRFGVGEQRLETTLQATRKDIDTAIAIFEELGSRLELGGMSVVVQASRPHHNPLSNALSFVGQASRLPGAWFRMFRRDARTTSSLKGALPFVGQPSRLPGGWVDFCHWECERNFTHSSIVMP